MSTALIRDIRSALFDFGRPVPEDVTLTTGVRELIAAVSESEDDLLRAEVERDKLATDLRDLRNTTASLRADLDAALAQRKALIATANQRLYNAKGVAFFAGVAVATIVEALLRMAQ